MNAVHVVCIGLCADIDNNTENVTSSVMNNQQGGKCSHLTALTAAKITI